MLPPELKGLNAQQYHQTEQWLQEPEHHLLTPHDVQYPKQLKHIHHPPKTLFAIGNTSILNDPQIAIVGSRRMSAYGKTNAFEFAKYLSQMGLIITSGLALGIDSMAHQGTLAAQGQTVAVLGNGLLEIYPKSHQKLAEEILAHDGCLVSPFPLHIKPDRSTFPQRNAIITGMSLGTLVVEAAVKSGSLISARLAMEQGREVFTIPGSIHSPMSKGCHQLLRQGAKLVESAQDILTELAPQLANHLNQSETTQKPTESNTPLDATQQQILNALQAHPTPIDAIMETTQLSLEVISSTLLRLELEGYVNLTTGGYQRSK